MPTSLGLDGAGTFLADEASDAVSGSLSSRCPQICSLLFFVFVQHAIIGTCDVKFQAQAAALVNSSFSSTKDCAPT